MDPRRTLLARASQRFAIESDSGLVRRWGRRCAADDPLGPDAQFRFHFVAVYVPKDCVQRCRTGRVVGKARSASHTGTVIAPPFADGAIAAIATEHRATGQREDSRQGMA